MFKISMLRHQINQVKRTSKILSRTFKNKIKFYLFKNLRKVALADSLGIICKSRYCLDFEKIESKQNIKTKILLYSDTEKTAIPKFIAEQESRKIHPKIVTDEIALLDINDVRFSLRNNRLINPDLQVICDNSFSFEEMKIYRNFIDKTIYINGTVVYLFDPTPMNYYHWMCRVLPKIAVYQTIIDIAKIDFFYVGKFKISSFHRESLAKAGIEVEKIIQHGCTADRIIAAIHNDRKYSWPYSLISKEYSLFTRNLFVEEKIEQNCFSRQYPKRIYVSRQTALTRKISNINEVLDLLKIYGFESITMDGLTIQEQANIFSQAEAIVAPHGAALTNLLFVQQQTKVIEIFPFGYVDTMYYLLSSYGKAEYYYLIGEKRQVHRYRKNQNQIKKSIANRDRNIHVDIKKLDTLCKMAFT